MNEDEWIIQAAQEEVNALVLAGRIIDSQNQARWVIWAEKGGHTPNGLLIHYVLRDEQDKQTQANACVGKGSPDVWRKCKTGRPLNAAVYAILRGQAIIGTGPLPSPSKAAVLLDSKGVKFPPSLAQERALRNCYAVAKQVGENEDPVAKELAQNIIRFCEQGGVSSSILRARESSPEKEPI